MPNTVRLKDFAKTATTLASDDYIYAGGQTNGTRKILGSDVANYVASEEGGSTLASLSGGKVPTAQLPWTSETFLGTSTVAGLPAPGGLSAGEYYITTDAGTNHSVTFAAGDKAISDGTSYYAVADGVRPIGEGGTGASTAEGARTNLEVDSKDEIAEGLTRGEPSLWFNGTNEYVSVADNAALSFTDGTDDLPFSVSMWVKCDDWTSQFLLSKYGGSSGLREWAIDSSGSGSLVFFLTDTGADGNGVDSCTTTLSGMSAYNGQYIHLTITYAGAGPNSSNAFDAAQDGVNIYINGVDQAAAAHNNNDEYGGQTGTLQAVHIGRENNSYGEFELRNVQLFNVALTAAQVEQVYRSGVPYELSQASAAAVYESDFSAGVDGWTATDGTAAGNIDSIGGKDDNLRLTVSASTGGPYLAKTVSHAAGKTYTVSFDYYIPSTNSHVDGINLSNFATGLPSHSSPALDQWNRLTATVVAANGYVRVYALDGGNTTVSDPGGDDVIYIRNFTSKEAGAILDLNAADASVSGSNINLPDRSGNGFSGTSSNMSLADNAVNLPAALSANHPNPSSGEKILSLGNAGTEKIGGTAEGHMVVSSMAAGVGSELTIASGVVTVSAGYHEIDTEGNAASDDLDTITASSWMGVGTRLVVMAIDDSHTVVLKDGTGNLRLAGDFSMDSNVDTMELIYDGTNWIELSRSNNN